MRGNKISFKIMLLTGLLLGTLDISAAFTDYFILTGKNPVATIPAYIASGIFGKAAFSGGVVYIMAGLLFHYFIALAFTFIYFWLYTKTTLLSRYWVLNGIGYGIFIWALMNLIVIPFSNAPHAPLSEMKLQKALKAAFILVCMIGLPVSLIADKVLKRE